MQKLLLEQEEFFHLMDGTSEKISYCIKSNRPYTKYLEQFFGKILKSENSWQVLSQVLNEDVTSSDDPQKNKIELDKLKGVIQRTIQYFWNQIKLKASTKIARNYYYLVQRLGTAIYNTVQKKIQSGLLKGVDLKAKSTPLDTLRHDGFSIIDDVFSHFSSHLSPEDQNKFRDFLTNNSQDRRIGNSLVHKFFIDNSITFKESIKNSNLLNGFRLMVEGKIGPEWYVKNIESCVVFYDLPFEEAIKYTNEFAMKNISLKESENLLKTFGSEEQRNNNLIGIAKQFAKEINKSNLSQQVKDYVANTVVQKIKSEPDKIWQTLVPQSAFVNKEKNPNKYKNVQFTNVHKIFSKLLVEMGFSPTEIGNAIRNLTKGIDISEFFEKFEKKFRTVDVDLQREVLRLAYDLDFISSIPTDDKKTSAFENDDEDYGEADKEDSKANPVQAARKLISKKIAGISGMGALSAVVVGIMLFKMFGGSGGQPAKVDPTSDVRAAIVQTMDTGGDTGPTGQTGFDPTKAQQDLDATSAEMQKQFDAEQKEKADAAAKTAKPTVEPPKAPTAPDKQAPEEKPAPQAPIEKSIEDLVKIPSKVGNTGYLGQPNLFTYQDSTGQKWVKSTSGDKLGKMLMPNELVKKVNDAKKAGIKFNPSTYKFTLPSGETKTADGLLQTDINKALAAGHSEKDLQTQAKTAPPAENQKDTAGDNKELLKKYPYGIMFKIKQLGKGANPKVVQDTIATYINDVGPEKITASTATQLAKTGHLSSFDASKIINNGLQNDESKAALKNAGGLEQVKPAQQSQDTVQKPVNATSSGTAAPQPAASAPQQPAEKAPAPKITFDSKTGLPSGPDTSPPKAPAAEPQKAPAAQPSNTIDLTNVPDLDQETAKLSVYDIIQKAGGVQKDPDIVKKIIKARGGIDKIDNDDAYYFATDKVIDQNTAKEILKNRDNYTTGVIGRLQNIAGEKISFTDDQIRNSSAASTLDHTKSPQEKLDMGKRIIKAKGIDKITKTDAYFLAADKAVDPNTAKELLKNSDEQEYTTTTVGKLQNIAGEKISFTDDEIKRSYASSTLDFAKSQQEKLDMGKRIINLVGIDKIIDADAYSLADKEAIDQNTAKELLKNKADYKKETIQKLEKIANQPSSSTNASPQNAPTDSQSGEENVLKKGLEKFDQFKDKSTVANANNPEYEAQELFNKINLDKDKITYISDRLENHIKTLPDKISNGEMTVDDVVNSAPYKLAKEMQQKKNLSFTDNKIFKLFKDFKFKVDQLGGRDATPEWEKNESYNFRKFLAKRNFR